MSNPIERRDFLKHVAGSVAFVGCSLTRAAAQSGRTATRHAPVMLRGRRVKTVDAHAHCIIPDALRPLKRPVNREADLPMAGAALASRVAAMDAQGIDMAVVSVIPNWYDAERDLAPTVVSLQNEQLAAFCSTHAERFAALATVALQFPDLAAEQLERAVKTLGFRGVAIATMAGGHWPIRNSIRSGRRPKPWAWSSRSIRSTCPIPPIATPATASSEKSSDIRSKPRSRCLI
jgi:aminocarboxymuconate-semialdehyde decarboxylase